MLAKDGTIEVRGYQRSLTERTRPGDDDVPSGGEMPRPNVAVRGVNQLHITHIQIELELADVVHPQVGRALFPILGDV